MRQTFLLQPYGDACWNPHSKNSRPNKLNISTLHSTVMVSSDKNEWSPYIMINLFIRVVGIINIDDISYRFPREWSNTQVINIFQT